MVAGLGPDCAVNLHALPGGDSALHLVNYAYDEESDRVVPGHDVAVRLHRAAAAGPAPAARPRRPSPLAST